MAQHPNILLGIEELGVFGKTCHLFHPCSLWDVLAAVAQPWLHSLGALGASSDLCLAAQAGSARKLSGMDENGGAEPGCAEGPAGMDGSGGLGRAGRDVRRARRAAGGAAAPSDARSRPAPSRSRAFIIALLPGWAAPLQGQSGFQDLERSAWE